MSLLVANETLMSNENFVRDFLDIEAYFTERSFAYYGVLLPLFAILGTLGCLLLGITYCHPRLRGFSGRVLRSLVVCDMLNLTCLLLLYTPVMWLPRWYGFYVDRPFMEAIGVIQYRYIMLYTVTAMAHALVAWYSVLYVIEYTCFIFRTRGLLNFSTADNVAKMITFVFMFVIIIHFMSFFALTRRNSHYNVLSFYRVCLADVYTAGMLPGYDQHFYPVVTFGIPWLVMFVMFVLLVVFRNYSDTSLVDAQQQPNSDLPVLMNAARSRRLTFALAAVYLVCEGVCLGIYWFVVGLMDFSDDPHQCHSVPRDRRFMKAAAVYETMYVLFMTTQSVVRLPMCLLSSRACREVFLAKLGGFVAYWRGLCTRVRKSVSVTPAESPEEAIVRVRDSAAPGNGSRPGSVYSHAKDNIAYISDERSVGTGSQLSRVSRDLSNDKLV